MKDEGQATALWRRALPTQRARTKASAAHLVHAPRPPPAEWLAEQPFTLALSAGFFGFFAHTGLLCALDEAKLWPRRIVGTSAGAITGGLAAAGLSTQRLTALNEALRREDFWDPGLVVPGLLPGRRLERLLNELLASVNVERIESCRLPFAAIAFDVGRLRSQVLASGPMARAIRASAALPGLFRPVRIGNALLCDGGVRDRGAHSALAPHERTLLHHIGSKAWLHRLTNPGVLADTPQRRTLVARPAPRIDPRRLVGGVAVQQAAYEHARAWLRGAASGV